MGKWLNSTLVLLLVLVLTLAPSFALQATAEEVLEAEIVIEAVPSEETIISMEDDIEVVPAPNEELEVPVDQPVAEEILTETEEDDSPVSKSAVRKIKLVKDDKIDLNVGERLQITLDGEVIGKIKSDKAKVASVSETGLVSAVGEGKAKISITTVNKQKLKLTITVTDPYKPDSISFVDSNITMNVGDSLTVRPVLKPETAKTTCTWKSKKTKVAAVSQEGVVRALAEGKSKITVQTANKKKAAINITVIDPFKPDSVSFGKSSITMNVGDSLTLDPVLKPDTAKTTYGWKSSKAKVATISSKGEVKALTEGKARITVQTANKKKATIAITVVDPYKPDSVSFAKNAITMNVGDSLKLKPVLKPNTAKTTYRWKSSKEKIVRVAESGEVRALTEGVAKISVQTANKKTAAISITVVNPFKASGISLSAKAVTLTPGESYQLQAALIPSTAVETIAWKSSNSKVAKVDANGYIIAVSSGTATITATTGSKLSVKASVKVAYDMSSSRYKYFRKYMSEKEFAEAYKIASEIADRVRGEPLEDQLCDIKDILRQIYDTRMEYSMSAKHYNDPYGYLVLGKASCAGCARTTGFILNILGISYEHVNENKYSHQWARVKVGDEYWICDAYGLYSGPEPAVRKHPLLS